MSDLDHLSSASSGVVGKLEEKSALEPVPSKAARKRESVLPESVGSKRRLRTTPSSRRHQFQFESNILSSCLV